MLNRLLAGLLAVLALAIVVGLLLPAQYRIERSIVVARPAATVFALLNGFGHYQRWSPWLARDPEAEYRLSGPPNGAGARISWAGDPRRVGSGWQEITSAVPDERVEFRAHLDTLGSADGYFVIEPLDGAQVQLTWGFTGDLAAGQGFWGGLRGRYLGLFLERWIAPPMEAGLGRFRRYAEELPAANFGDAEIAVVVVTPQPILYVSGRTSQAPEDVAAALGAAFDEISAFMAAHRLAPAGQPLAITRGWDEHGYRFDAAVPVSGPLPAPEGRVLAGMSPGGRCARIVHRGPYQGILSSYEKLAAFMAAMGLEAGPVSWEHYVSDPTETAPEALVTHVYLQLAE